MRSSLSFQAKRELLVQIAARYRVVGKKEKKIILDEFVAATGYVRKYAIRLLQQPAPMVSQGIQRRRARRYGQAVQEALVLTWTAANCICAKRLVPFLPALVQSLEAHQHLTLTEEVRSQLLAISPATADRILASVRQRDRSRGVTSTKRGTLLKHQVPVRTFADWNETQPGFFEADAVAHGGTSMAGAFLWSLVFTDVATGWTECFALRHRSQDAVIAGLGHVRQLLPFALLGFDTDNGGEFLNQEVLDYCEREQITFTRGRAYKKNDQCFVEQKNGSIVRQLVGYDRYEGEAAYRQLVELYRAARLYVNFFQPCMKLRAKHRQGSKVWRSYDAAQTPFQRLVASEVLSEAKVQHLTQVFHALDPVRLLQQIQALQDALWRHAMRQQAPAPAAASQQQVCFRLNECMAAGEALASDQARNPLLVPGEYTGEVRKRKYHRVKKTLAPHTWRTRIDPFAEVDAELHRWFLAAPERTAKSLFQKLQAQHPGRFPDAQLRTLQRRVRVWRSQMFLQFDDHLVDADVVLTGAHPTTLRAFALVNPGTTPELSEVGQQPLQPSG